MTISRRYFLKTTGLSLFGAGFVPSFLRRAAFAMEQPGRKKILVAIFQRGAADGLNIVVPFGEKNYHALRPTIAIPEPSKRSDGGLSALDLDGFFGLHPGLASLKPLFDARHLAIVHAAGSPDSTRSHFDAQDYMESATPGVKSTPDGWLNRFLQGAAQPDATPFRAVAFAASTPRTMMGPASCLCTQDLQGFHLAGNANPQGHGVQRAASAFEEMYASASDRLLSRTAHETFEAISTLQRMQIGVYQPENGADYPRGPLGKSLQQIAQLIKSGAGLEVAFAEVGGWDNHVNEGGVNGQLANRLKDFGDSLAAFHKDMGDRMADITVLTMSEFGRTARENGNHGTDHGHAHAMFVLGGSVKGGKVYGKWPGLSDHQLHDGRDLALTTDFRDVFAEVAMRHLGVEDPAGIFPGYAVSPARFRGFLS
ncbi:MAG: DUF1501 domain-containing protein [Terriglobia bacterium]|jgi:uncharacterized protein (DUF1501 family)